jgi:hypothetical protein
VPFIITHEPLISIRGVKPKTVVKESAKEAWHLVDALMRSDEQVTLSGDASSWQELQMLAER